MTIDVDTIKPTQDGPPAHLSSGNDLRNAVTDQLDARPPSDGFRSRRPRFSSGNPAHVSSAWSARHQQRVAGMQLLSYTRDQDARFRVFPEHPAELWLVFMEGGTHEGAHRSRFYGAYANAGETFDERTETNRRFHLSESPFMESLKNRLVIEWTTPRRWHRRGALAAEFRVLEIADPQVIPFPGYDRIELPYARLQRILDDPHYSRWHSALNAVKGIYLIADASNGKQYVGKADGAEGILGRWKAYADDGHGGNVALRDLDNLDLSHREHFIFSILRVFGPEATQKQVSDSEMHYKKTLLSREFGYNEN